MYRTDVRDWLHQAALDVARLAEPRRTDGPGRESVVWCAGHESFLEAEREARDLAARTGEPHVVVEVRDDQDPPGIEAIFVVCPEDAVSAVKRGQEVVLRADLAGLRSERAERALRDALRLVRRALQIVEQGCDQAMQDLLRDLQRSLQDAHRLSKALSLPDGGGL